MIGGILAGVGMVLVIAPSLGLELLTGGVRAPAASVSLAVILALVASALILLGLAMVAEVLSHRRDRLNDVLRVGD